MLSGALESASNHAAGCAQLNFSIMGLLAKNKGGVDFKPIPQAMHEAVCYGLVDLGTQPGGDFKPARKVVFIWELPNERIEIEKDGAKQNRPRAISQRFTLSLSEKSNLKPMLESWRGRSFTAEELDGFDLKNVLGANCLLNVVHKPGSGQNANKIFAEVASVSPLLKGMPKRQAENPLLYFSFEDAAPGPIREFPPTMPEWIQDAIKESEEYRERMRGPQVPAGTGSMGGKPVADEDVPF